MLRLAWLERIPFSAIRSKLFVPGSRSELFQKAVASDADALSFDLEGSVAAEGKTRAREAVSGFLRENAIVRQCVIVRVNGISSGWFEHDVEALAGCPVDCFNVPKVESAKDVHSALSALGGKTKILANIETPRAVRQAAEIAAAGARVAGLQIGFVDLFSQFGIDPGEAAAKYSIRLAVRLAAAEAGIAVFDSAFASLQDAAGFRTEAESARRLGFTGKSCIHPSQVAIANEVFAPSRAEIARAQRILEAALAHADTVFQFDGQMIDKPVLDRARDLLRAAEEQGR